MYITRFARPESFGIGVSPSVETSFKQRKKYKDIKNVYVII